MHLCGRWCALWLLLLSVLAWSDENPADASIAVEHSSHIVIGTVKNVAVVSLYNGILYKLNPEPRQLTSYTAAQLEVQVDEVLYPPGWTPPRTIKYLFGGGLLSVAQIKNETLNKQSIFLLQAQSDNKIMDNNPIFYPGYENRLALPLKAKADIKNHIARRLKKENKPRPAEDITSPR
jgi:hypothetical protein